MRGKINIPVSETDQYRLHRRVDLGALGCLLTPFDHDRFEQAFEGALEGTTLRAVEAVTDRFRRCLDASNRAAAAAGAPDDPADVDPIRRLPIDLPGTVRVVSVE